MSVICFTNSERTIEIVNITYDTRIKGLTFFFVSGNYKKVQKHLLLIPDLILLFKRGKIAILLSDENFPEPKGL